MSIAPISSGNVSQAAEVVAKAAPAPAATAPATLQPDTVSISSAGKAAAAAGDVDHDGDSR
jgi:hypothetical protein